MRRCQPRTSLRRIAPAILSIALVLPLLGCATPPPPPPDRATVQQQALKKLGFVEEGTDWNLNLAGRVLFDVDETTPNAEGAAALAEVAKVLLSVGIDHLTVEGHADNSGSPEHNQSLSERRAQVVAKTLSTYGFPMANIKWRGYGASRPFAGNDTAAGRAQNRRAVLIVSSH
jgi:outer membrane protein OmpA-like peptidoglycan-associated protein